MGTARRGVLLAASEKTPKSQVPSNAFVCRTKNPLAAPLARDQHPVKTPMQDIKTNPLGIRVTDAELQRLKAIKATMALPSMANTTLGHDLLVMGMDFMESRSAPLGKGQRAVAVESQTSPKKKVAKRKSRKPEAGHV
jgi:hypothetical protein